MNATSQNLALKNAALLRERIIGCVKAAPSPMTVGAIAEWPSVQEQAPGKRGYYRVINQIGNLVKNGVFERIGVPKSGASYAYKGEVVAKPKPSHEELVLQIDRTKKTVRFVFHGMAISIEMLS